MAQDRSQRACELFEQALERPADERPAFLTEACAGEDELRAEVEALLAHDSRVPDDFMPPPELEPIPEPGLTRPEPTPARSRDPLLGTRIGGFLIQSVIGSGGMGKVYAAEQDQPHRRVALKIIKLGMDTAEVLGPYATAFAATFIGVTGDRETTALFAQQVNAAFAKVPSNDGGYTMDHTGNLVIINPMGHYHGFIKLPHKAETIRLTYQSLAARFQ